MASAIHYCLKFLVHGFFTFFVNMWTHFHQFLKIEDLKKMLVILLSVTVKGRKRKTVFQLSIAV